jgi:hypothetical protein
MTNGPTGREWGELSKEVDEILTSQAEILHELEIEFRKEVQSLMHDVKTVQTKIYTTMSVVGVVASVVVFVVSIAKPMIEK